MSGHSKWANIQHRKGRQDAKRSNIWTKLIREIIVAARLGGGDADSNPRLRLALLKARGTLLALGRAHHAHGPVGRAVVGAAHADELRAPREALGELERPLDRLGARVHEVEAVDGLRQQRGDLRGIAHLRPLDQLAVDHHVHVARRLLLHGPHHGGGGLITGGFKG